MSKWARFGPTFTRKPAVPSLKIPYSVACEAVRNI